MAEYRSCPQDVLDMAYEVIAKYHPDLQYEGIRFVFRDEAVETNGKVTLGKARKVSGLNRHLSRSTTDFFVVELAEDKWELLTDGQRIALLDHELNHCRVIEKPDGGSARYIAPHDLEEFACVVERHGLWKPDVEQMARAMHPQLFDADTGEIISDAQMVAEVIREAADEINAGALGPDVKATASVG